MSNDKDMSFFEKLNIFMVSLLNNLMKFRMKKAVLACFLSFCTVFVCAQNWDINTLHRINSWDSGFPRSYSKFISGSTPVVLAGIPAGMAIYAAIKKDQPLLQNAIYVGSSVAEALVLTYAMKYTFDRQRPYDRYPDRVYPSNYEDSPSFPSAHTAGAFSLATSLCIKYPKWYVIAPSALWACSVGFARMNEGVHYPTDVIGGAAIGAGCAVANVYINRWLNSWLFGKGH